MRVPGRNLDTGGGQRHFGRFEFLLALGRGATQGALVITTKGVNDAVAVQRHHVHSTGTHQYCILDRLN